MVISYIAEGVFKNVYKPPIVSEEIQEKFNRDIEYESRSYKYEDLTYDEYFEFKENANPLEFDYTSRGVIDMGLALIDIGYGEWKYDGGYYLSQMYDINETRECRLNTKAKETRIVIFWSFFIGLLLVRYLMVFVKWIKTE